MASEDQVEARRGYLRRRPLPRLRRHAVEALPGYAARIRLSAEGYIRWYAALVSEQVNRHSRRPCGQDLRCRVSTVAAGR